MRKPWWFGGLQVLQFKLGTTVLGTIEITSGEL